MKQEMQSTEDFGTSGPEDRFLVEAALVLASSLDYEETLSAVARLAVRSLADLCVVDLVEDGEVRRLQAAHADPAYAQLAEALLTYPLDRQRPHLSLSALETGEPELVPRLSPDDLESVAQDARHLHILRSLHPRSLMAVPVLARGSVLGVILFVSSSRTYDALDLAVAAQLGRIAGLELENARQYRTLRQALVVRDRVLGVVAHDLRNPLNTITMSADLLNSLPLSEQQRAHQVRVITRSAQRMNRLIQDLLDVSIMEAGRVNLERRALSPQALAQEAVDLNAPRAAARSIRLEVAVAQGTPRVSADPDRMIQVLSNLIDNAIRFTPDGGRIAVIVRAVEGGVQFGVADTGSGIPADDLPHLFDSFWRGGNGSGGTGLGLAIARGIVEAHGGTIWAESTPGQGSVFNFTVPAIDSSRRNARAAMAAQRSGSLAPTVRHH